MASKRERVGFNGAHNRHGWVGTWRDGASSSDGSDFAFEAGVLDLATTIAHSETRPETAVAALMQCSPGDYPETARSELIGLRDIIEDAVITLDPREQYVFNAVACERLSLRLCGDRLGLSKSQVARIRDAATAKLREVLIEHDDIRRYLKR